jgi:hypothetical protein
MKSRARGDFSGSDVRCLTGAANAIPMMFGLRVIAQREAGFELRRGILAVSIYDSGAVGGEQRARVESGLESDCRKESFVGAVQTRVECAFSRCGPIQAPLTTTMSVTIPADAGLAPATVVSDL